MECEKVLVTGAAGQLGHDVVKELEARGVPCVGIDKDELDITDGDAVKAFFAACGCDAVIHCAAYTAVDKAEDEAELCEKVNFAGTRNLAGAAAEIGAKFLYVSTDYCFDGRKGSPYETCDEPSPETVYGRTKLMGEDAVREATHRHFIVRTAWVFGKNGGNFVKTILRLAKERDEISVVCDQYGSPTYTVDLAKLLCDIIVTEKFGTYHATNEGFCSWADFAREIIALSGSGANVRSIASSEYPCRAKRPLDSRLSKASLTENGFEPLPPWKDALERFLKSMDE